MIAVINDTHFGARNDSPVFLENAMRFWEETFFPTLVERKVTKVLHLGDFLDRRKYVNFSTLAEVNRRFLAPMRAMGVHMDLILGNHDVFYKNTNSVNSPMELLSSHSNVTVHRDPTILYVEGVAVGLVPWITKDNSEECLGFLRDAPVDVIFGHLEITGYEAHRGIEFREGMDSSVLSRFLSVYSGHFHCRHAKGNVHYLGTQYQMTFGDLGERKGFHLYDPREDVMEFVENPLRMFHEIVYDDVENDHAAMDVVPYANSFVRLSVKRKTKPLVFDNLIDRLTEAPVHGISMEDSPLDEREEEGDGKADLSKGTMTLIYEEIDSMQGVADPVRLKDLIKDIHAEAV